MKVLVTGANGFIGQNLMVCLREKGIESIPFLRATPLDKLPDLLKEVDFIFHLAGVNRPQSELEFFEGNAELTEYLCEAIKASKRKIPVLYTSSIQATRDNPYGSSKHAAEEALIALEKEAGAPVYLYRLLNVFGKWCRPNYNSVVATFCHNIANDLPISISDPKAALELVYIDDVVASFMRHLDDMHSGLHWPEIAPVYRITLGALAEQISIFKESRTTMVAEAVGCGFARALYATYLSYLRPERFAYSVQTHADARGRFVEMLKTKDSGQFSFFTAHPGITRGGHYHHTKNEKFLVIQGEAHFGFRHVVSGESYEIMVDGEHPQIVETVPGWSHDITNIGNEEMIVMLWANEIFDRQHPDTIAYEVKA